MSNEPVLQLSNAQGVAHITNALDLAEKMLSQYMPTKRIYGNNVIGTLQGECDKTIMLEAHWDEVGFIVTAVDDGGFLKVKNIGAVDARVLPSKPVLIHGKETVCGVFGSVPPHLKGNGDKPCDIDGLFIDTGLKEKAKDIISLGDIVTFDIKAELLANGRVAGKSLDNRAGVLALIECAKLLQGKKLPYNVCFLLSSNEEIGLRGAKTAAYSVMPDEAVSVDVSFGNSPCVDSSKTQKLGSGTMIGVSPFLSENVFNKLKQLAEQNNLPYTVEVMAGATGTDADVISSTGGGVPCGLLSIPLRCMHSPVEVVDSGDIYTTAQLLGLYVQNGGTLNA